MGDDAPFWKTTPLAAMSKAQWESLCDGCGRCCLLKFREDDGSLTRTNVACLLLDVTTGRCGDYRHRKKRVPDCVTLTPRALRKPDWLPETCAYRRLAEGRELPDWHPLITGDPGSVAAAGYSVAGRCISEREAGPPELHVVSWPGL